MQVLSARLALALGLLWFGAGACGGGSARSDAALQLGDGAADGASVDAGDAQSAIAVDAKSPGRVRMAVPAYFAPGADWQRVMAGAPTVGLVIINPASGPGTTTDPSIAQAVTQARAAGIVVLGYIGTNYGQRASTDVLADVTGYYNLYSPSGIYFAEGPLEADCATLEATYRAYAEAARARDAHAYLAVGTPNCPTYVYFFDLMVLFAQTWTEFQTYTPPAWMPTNSPERFGNFVSGVPPASASAALTRAVANGAGWIFITDQPQPNPWAQLPTYFDTELQALRALVP